MPAGAAALRIAVVDTPPVRAGPVGPERRRGTPDRPYRELFERSPQPMIVYERSSLRVIAVSDAAIRNYGYTRGELLAMTIMELLPIDERAALERFLAVELRAARPGRVDKRAWRLIRKDGGIIDLEVSSDDLDLDGRRGRILYCQDVTVRNRASRELERTRDQLRVSEQRYRLLFEHNPQPMVAFERETLTIVAVGNAMVRDYGYSREEFQRMTILDLAVPEDVEQLKGFFAGDPGGSRPGPGGVALGYPRRRQRKDGTTLEVEVTSDNVELDGRACRVAHYTDVTQRNEAAAELAIARDRAVEASNTKSAFLANVSHELRTPMNGVIGMNELMLTSELSDEQRSFAEQVAQSGEQMLAIINDILDVSKLEAGRLELEVADFDLHEAIDAACAAPRTLAQARGLRFDVRIGKRVPRLVRGDGRRLQQVLLNLTSNAVKFTATGSVTVSAGVRAGGGGATRLSIGVTDTGIGVDPAQLEHMFDPFTQADVSTTRLYGGTGLGLAIVRELVDLMGGTVSAESEDGNGATFRFELELAAPASDAGSLESPNDAPVEALPAWITPPLVLVAEDSPVNQIVAARALERLGCRAEVVHDGEQALAALGAGRYDAVLMDCQMPRLDGYAATKELRRREAGSQRTPVIAMTANAMAGDRERCQAAGMDDYVSKPMRHRELAEALRRWIPAPDRA